MPVKVSVIIPVFNSALWLPDCLESVCEQTLQNIEIICVNDGSSDESPAILRKYAEKDDRIRVIDQINSGISCARNAGARAASGEYLYFLDSDDYIDPRTLEVLSETMDSGNLQLACFNTFAFGEDPENIELAARQNDRLYRRQLIENKVFTGRELFLLLRKERSFLSSAALFMIRRAFFTDQELWFIPGILHEDVPWSFATVLLADKIGCVNRIFHHRRYRENSIMTKPVTFDNVYGYFRGIISMDQTAEKHGLRGELLESAEGFIRMIRRNAHHLYCSCSDQEKQRLERLSPEEQAFFHQLIVNSPEKTEPDCSNDEMGRFSVLRGQFRTGIAKGRNETAYISRCHSVLKNKIVIQLRSQLGNQMFIYALYLKLKSMGKNVSFDTGAMEKSKQWRYSKHLLPDTFQLYLPTADEDEINALLDTGVHKTDKLRRKLLGVHAKTIHEADDYAYDERLLTANSGYFTGWFQNSRYFTGIENEVRAAFRFRELPRENKQARMMEEKILTDECPVSIHMRLDDYLSERNRIKHGSLTPEAYYRSAMEKILTACPDRKPTFYVFSDDCKMAAEIISSLTGGSNAFQTVSVDVCSPGYSWIDMYLMSICHHNIIANSTFSWWAAWLNRNPGKMLISPAFWQNKEGKLYPGVLLENAVRIDTRGQIVS